ASSLGGGEKRDPGRERGQDPQLAGLTPWRAVAVAGLTAGTRPSMTVPLPGAEVTRSWPPRAARRSLIPWMPVPCHGADGPHPPPSSATEIASAPSPSDNRMVILVATAYLAQFCRASRAQKYTAVSASCG